MIEAKIQARLIEQLAALASRSAYVCAHDYESKTVGTRLMAIADLKAEFERTSQLFQELNESGALSPEAAPNSEAIASSLKRAGSGAPDCDVELAIALSRYVHDNCTNVPHDIGIHLAHIVDEYQKRRPVLPNADISRRTVENQKL